MVVQPPRDNSLALGGLGVLSLGCLVPAVVSIVQCVGCYAFLTGYWEWPWFVALPVVVVLLVASAGLLVSVGCFLGAWLVWGWAWWWALLLAAPGLVLFVVVVGGALGLFGLARATARVRELFTWPAGQASP